MEWSRINNTLTAIVLACFEPIDDNNMMRKSMARAQRERGLSYASGARVDEPRDSFFNCRAELGRIQLWSTVLAQSCPLTSEHNLGNTTGLNTWYPKFGPTLEITHPMVHLAMNRHLFGPPHGDSLDVFFKPFQEDVINRVNISTRACIFANEFYLRWQYRIVIPFSEGFDHVWKVSFGVCICPHLQTTLAQKDIITRISECMLSHRDTGSSEK